MTKSKMWHDIELTQEEWDRWQTGKETPEQTINNILESGLHIREAIVAGNTLTDADAKIAKRIEQVVEAANTYAVVNSFCSERLLEAYTAKS